MAIFDYAQPSPIAGAFGATIRGVYPSNLDMMLRSMGYGQTAMTSGGSFGGSTNAGSQQGPNAGQQNDTMAGGQPDQAMQAAFGTDLFNDQGFTGAFGPGLGPNKGTQPGASVVPGLPSFNEPTAPQAPASPADLGMTSPDDQNSAANQTTMNDITDKSANLDSKSMSDVSPEGALGGMGSPAGVPGSEQNSPNAVGAAMGATGMATGMDSGQHGSFGGGTAFGGGSGDGSGGNGSPGANGVGNSNDAGSGTPGAGQSGEGGQWRVGTAHTGDDSDMDRDEPVKGQVHENEAVLPRELRDLIGQDTLSHMIRVSRSKLSDNQKKALIRALWS